jgi:hypothetical protein
MRIHASPGIEIRKSFLDISFLLEDDVTFLYEVGLWKLSATSRQLNPASPFPISTHLARLTSTAGQSETHFIERQAKIPTSNGFLCRATPLQASQFPISRQPLNSTQTRD